MGCLYCGQAIPPRRRRFCSDRCSKNYYELLRQRKIKRFKVPLAWCKNCGRILKFNQREYCCKECEDRRKGTKQNYNKLRLAIVKQAKEDHALDLMCRTGAMYQLFPGTDPEYIKRLITKGETR